MSLAADTRRAVRARPFLLASLRAGVLNYTAAAEWLADDARLDGDREAIATALRRFADDLDEYASEARRTSVSVRSGVAFVDADARGAADRSAADTPLLCVGGSALADGGSDTAVVASGDVDAAALACVLDRLRAVGVEVEAAGVADDALLVVVGRRDGADAIRVVEDALGAVPA